jgi:chitosanase
VRPTRLFPRRAPWQAVVASVVSVAALAIVAVLAALAALGGRDDGAPDPPAPEVTAMALPAGPAARPADLTSARLREIAFALVSSAENSSLDWRAQYRYIEDIGDGRGYTGGVVGFCSGTGDMLKVVDEYERLAPGNALSRYRPALRAVDGTDSHDGLDPGFPGDWRAAATDPLFRRAQDTVRDRLYLIPAVDQARADGLRALGQFSYFDALVMHGTGDFARIRNAAIRTAKPPSDGGDEATYVRAFLDARVSAMTADDAHRDTTRVDTAQRVFLRQGKLDLQTPLRWRVYGQGFSITG